MLSITLAHSDGSGLVIEPGPNGLVKIHHLDAPSGELMQCLITTDDLIAGIYLAANSRGKPLAD